MIRINPEGIELADKIKGTNKWYMNNSHIWAILSKERIRDSDTKKLITYLSLLLNKEWEKSKKLI